MHILAMLFFSFSTAETWTSSYLVAFFKDMTKYTNKMTRMMTAMAMWMMKDVELRRMTELVNIQLGICIKFSLLILFWVLFMLNLTT